MAQLAKNLRIPDVESIKDMKTLKDFLRHLLEELQTQHRVVHNDINQMESANFILSNVRWRIIVVGNDLEFQKMVSGTWIKAAEIKGV